MSTQPFPRRVSLLGAPPDHHYASEKPRSVFCLPGLFRARPRSAPDPNADWDAFLARARTSQGAMPRRLSTAMDMSVAAVARGARALNTGHGAAGGAVTAAHGHKGADAAGDDDFIEFVADGEEVGKRRRGFRKFLQAMGMRRRKKTRPQASPKAVESPTSEDPDSPTNEESDICSDASSVVVVDLPEADELGPDGMPTAEQLDLE